MLNQIVLVGRLTKDPEIITHDNNIKRTAVDLAVPRSYKNVDGVYETDYIKCVLWNGIAKNTCEYCKKGDLIGVKGRIQTSNYEKNGEKKYVTEVIAERVTFLSSNKNTEAKTFENEEE